MQERSRRAADAGAVATVTMSVSGTLCRRCVRIISRRVRDVPGVESLEVDAARGVVRVHGDVDRAALVAALESDDLGGCEAPAVDA
jgi:copper chaperone CopZ